MFQPVGDLMIIYISILPESQTRFANLKLLTSFYIIKLDLQGQLRPSQSQC